MIASLRRRLPVPAPLAWLLLAVLILGVAWALMNPPFQSPDENQHFAYAQSLAERGKLPGDPRRVEFSLEQVVAQDRSNAVQTAHIPETRPEWSRAAYERYRKVQDALPPTARSDGGGDGAADSNPPLYYAYATPAYKAASAGDLFSRLYSMRLLSVLLLLVTATGAWLLAGELFGRRRELQLATAGVAGLAPMATFISASVNPDAMLLATWSLAMWLGVRTLRPEPSWASGLLLGGMVALALLTKATSLALLAPLVLVLGIALRRTWVTGRGRMVAAAIAAAALALPAGAIALSSELSEREGLTDPEAIAKSAGAETADASGRDAGTVAPAQAESPDPAPPRHQPPFQVREFASYVWQFYLPRLPFQRPFERTDVRGPIELVPAYEVWIKGAWGRFGWLEVELPGPLYLLLALITLAVAIGALTALWRIRSRLDTGQVAFLALVTLSLVGGLHLIEYRDSLNPGIGFINQGRYLLPLLPVAGLAVALVLSQLPARVRLAGLGAALGGLVALQLVSLAITAVRFYA